MIKATGIHQKELCGSGGRIDQYRYQKLLQLIDYYDFPIYLPEQGIIGEIYEGFSDITNVFLNSPSLYQALQSFIHYRPCIGEPDYIGLTTDEYYLTIQYHSEFNQSIGLRSAVYNFNIIDAIIHYYSPDSASCCEMILDGQITEDIINDISDAFHCTIKTGHENIYRIPVRMLHCPASHYNPVLQPYLSEKAERCLQEIPSTQVYSSQIRSLILRYLQLSPERHPGYGSLQQWICEQSNISRWTLTRRLQQEGTTLTQLYSELRCNEACRLLQKDTHSLLDISQSLGFVNQSAFQRFFREQMDCTPLKYRKLYTQAT
ncbi:AraC family transcriptional regulator [Vibrio quintilis]|uniref:CFA/I fimbrial subunit D n=1 Tax=Vibrio quintilis TaxID=1117707 RepID=A0A1M7YT18_9VIBR|nr:helix-turn-helix domain-containing protein [Vibrio quintilis]SHO55764.1 CFA/I fimbrial subunit D [Vibrio quintilis]